MLKTKSLNTYKKSPRDVYYDKNKKILSLPVSQYTYDIGRWQYMYDIIRVYTCKAWVLMKFLLTLKRWTLNEQQSINRTGYIFIFFCKRRRKISEPRVLLTQTRVCINSWLKLQDGSRRADSYKARNYELNLLDEGKYFKQVPLHL